MKYFGTEHDSGVNSILAVVKQALRKNNNQKSFKDDGNEVLSRGDSNCQPPYQDTETRDVTQRHWIKDLLCLLSAHT